MNISSKFILICISLLILQACSSINTETKRSEVNDIIYLPSQQLERELAESKAEGGSSFFNNLFGNSNKKAPLQNQILVNPYLWQASLEILSSTMPLSSVDSSSGIIITDWYNLKSKNNERVKISILINSIELRADGVKVSIFKEIKNANTWNSRKVNPNIIQNLERKIIKKAGLLADAAGN
jgi:hypothetical protein